MGNDLGAGTAAHDDAELEGVDPETTAKVDDMAYEVLAGIGGLLVFLLALCSLAGVLLALRWAYRRRKRAAYEWIPSEEDLSATPTEETPRGRPAGRPEIHSTGREE